MHFEVNSYRHQNTEKKPTKYNFSRKLEIVDPLIVAELYCVVKMFKQVLSKLVDTKWRTAEQADGILTGY